MTELVAAWREAASEFRFAWRALVATDILYTVLATVILVPAVTISLSAFMYFSGSDIYADQEILFFFLTPLGLVTLIVVAGAAVAVGALELACLTAIAIAARERRRLTALAALKFALSKLWAVQWATMRLVLRVLLLTTPFLAVAALIAWWLLSAHDINYYLSQRPPSFMAAAAAIAILLATMAVVLIRKLIGWAYVLPLVLFENIHPKAAFAVSEARARSHWRTLVLTLVSWIGASLLVSALLLGTVRWAGVTLASQFSDNLSVLVPALAVLLFVWFATALVAQLFGGCFLALLVVYAYGNWSGAEVGRVVIPGRATVDETLGPFSSRAQWLVLGAAAVMAIATGVGLMERLRGDQDVLVIAHRGASADAPENTLAAVEQAIAQGADWVEIDVQESADGEVVVIHDSDFMKIAGVATKIWEKPYEELARIDIGSWFNPEFSDQRLPTLDQVLELARGRAGVTIELKHYGHAQRLEERVVEIVEAADMAADVEVMSLKYDSVQKMRELRPDWRLGLLTARALGDLTDADADFLAVNTALATPKFIDRAHAAGKQVYVWTVNDLANMSRMTSRGADGLITDHPGTARELLTRRARLNSVERLLMDLAFRVGIDLQPPDIARETAGINGPSPN